jgi:hypothetical protein
VGFQSIDITLYTYIIKVGAYSIISEYLPELTGGYVKKLEKPRITHLVLDVLKPHQPPLPDFASFMGELPGLTKIDISVVEMDEKTESLKIIVEGTSLDYEELRSHMARQGAVIHSVDKVVVE